MNVILGTEAEHKYILSVFKLEYNLQQILVMQVMSKIVLISVSLWGCNELRKYVYYFLRKFPANCLLYLISLQKKSDPVVRSPMYEAPEIFRTTDFFLPDENTSDS